MQTRTEPATALCRRAARASLLALALAGLVACGSGGGDDDEPAGAPNDGTEPPRGTFVGTPTNPPTETPPESPPASGGDLTPPDDGELPRVDLRTNDQAYPYRPDSPFADVLLGCAVLDDDQDIEAVIESSCSLETLPFIAQDAPDPSIDDVMNRVLVTHDWMGERLEEVLRTSPPELVRMFGSVTSILIGSEVRPANYWPVTGAIQLDPIYLWTSVAEKQNVSELEDFRSTFGQKLAMRFLSSMRIDGRPAVTASFNLVDRSVRTLEDIVLPLSNLLFHELAHANDFLPPGMAGGLDRSMKPVDALVSIENDWLSPQLAGENGSMPLNSTLLIDLAQVRFRGIEPTEEQRAVTADVAGAEMANDGSTHFYSYSTIREDFANLVETAMLKRHYDVDLHVGFTNQPADFDNFFCDELLVGWGERNRLGDPSVSARAKRAVEDILGASGEFDAFFAEQAGTPTPMTVGVDWCTNRDGDGVAAKFADGTAAGTAIRERLVGELPMSHAARHALSGR